MKNLFYLSLIFLVAWSVLFGNLDKPLERGVLYAEIPRIQIGVGGTEGDDGGDGFGGSPILIKGTGGGGPRVPQCEIRLAAGEGGCFSSGNIGYTCQGWSDFPGTHDTCNTGTNCYVSDSAALDVCLPSGASYDSDCFCIGDGYCDTSAGETSQNSPSDGCTPGATIFQCSIKTGNACSSGETLILKVGDNANSHVEKANIDPTFAYYDSSLCCKVSGGSITVNYGSGGELLGSVTTPGYPNEQRHIKRGTSSASLDNIYLSSDLGNVQCSTASGIGQGKTGNQLCSGTGAGCVLTLTDLIGEGHVGSCSQTYDHAVCCKVG